MYLENCIQYKINEAINLTRHQEREQEEDDKSESERRIGQKDRKQKACRDTGKKAQRFETGCIVSKDA